MRKNPHQDDARLRRLIREFIDLDSLSTWGAVGSLFKPADTIDQEDELGSSSFASDQQTLDAIPATSARSLAPVDRTLDAAVIGDSQAGGPLGSAIAASLGDLGYQVKKTHENGATGAKVVENQLPSVLLMPDLVVAIFGGNDSSASSAVSAAKSLYDATAQAGSYLIIVGPPQATTITNPAYAGKVFKGSLGPDPMPNAWFTVDGGTYVERRLEISQALEREFEGLDSVSVFGIGAHMVPQGGIGTGEPYPDQPDGLHIVNGASDIAERVLRDANISQITRLLKSRLPAVDLEEPEESKPVVKKQANFGPIVPFDYNRWKEEIAQIESRGKYTAVNDDTNALGKYQFVPSIWWDNIKSYARKMGKELGSYSDFLRDPQLQEDFMKDYTYNDVMPAVKRMRRKMPDLTSHLSDGKIAGLIHFQGEGGGTKWLKHKVMTGAEVNATDPDGYMLRIT